jgi:ubiquinone/menaquinone biosynthesis C-methylase UbiE
MKKNNFNKNRKIISDYYRDRIDKYANNVETLGWSKKSQQLRFQIFTKIGNLRGKSLLDVGCGFGDFYDFLTKKRLCPKEYQGIDINPYMIEEARKKYPGTKFYVKDISKNSIKKSFDYVLASGLFGVDVPNWENFTYKILFQMFKVCKIGIGVNFLSIYTPYKKTNNIRYVNPSNLLKFIYNNLSPVIVLRHDYKPNDFTIFIYKEYHKN